MNNMEEKFALLIEHLSKSYGDVKAVKDISFSVKQGSLFAYLGVNGAGKSTTINMICSILKKDEGKIVVCGHDLDEEPFAVKRDIGVVFQTSVLDKELTVKQNLEIRTSFYSLPKQEKQETIDNIIALLELGNVRAGRCGGWTSPAPWCISPAFSFSTSRRRVSTPRQGLRSGRSSTISAFKRA